MKNISILVLMIFFFFSAGIFAGQSSEFSHENFAKHMIQSIGKSHLFSDDAEAEEYFNFLRNKGIEPAGGFQEGKIIPASEAVTIFKKLVGQGKNISPSLQSKLEAQFRNKITILGLQGNVEVLFQDDHKWIPASKNMQLHEGDKIKTSSNSATQLQVGNLGVVELKQNSHLDLKQMKLLVDGVNEDIHLHITKGKLLVNVQGMSKKSSFKTSSPSNVAAVRGTIYEISAD